MTTPPEKPLSDKALREKKLAEALRANLRRRKAAPRDGSKAAPADPDAVHGSPLINDK